MTKLAQEIKEAVDAVPFGAKTDEYDFSKQKSADVILRAVNEAGYVLLSEQRGIYGSYLYLVPKTE